MSISQTTRQLLLDTGLALAMEQGLSKLTVRGVTRRCGVNNGSFVYHFGTRDAFVREIMESWYAPVLQSVQREQVRNVEPLERIRAMLMQSVHFMRANIRFVELLVTDALEGEPACREFIASLKLRHPQLLRDAILDAQEKKLLRLAPPDNVLLYLYCAVGMPLILAGLSGDVVSGIFSFQAPNLAFELESAEQRLDWALRGLEP